MATGVIESISRNSIVVTSDNKTVSLIGKIIETKATEFKLGDNVEYTVDQDGVTATTLTQKKAAAAPQPAARTGSTSPVEKPQGKEAASW